MDYAIQRNYKIVIITADVHTIFSLLESSCFHPSAFYLFKTLLK